jgi:cyclopropane-fatty-acyl-phospholipid synthase
MERLLQLALRHFIRAAICGSRPRAEQFSLLATRTPVAIRFTTLVTDIEILRLHYAVTLKAWRQCFLAHRDNIERIYDIRFARMWEFYLAAAEMAFREQAMMVFQIQLTKRQGVVPMTRNYIMRETERLRMLEGRQRPPLRLAGE